jgi:hypothetical protein
MDSGRRGLASIIATRKRKILREFAAYETEEKDRLHNWLWKSGNLDKIRIPYTSATSERAVSQAT